MGEYFDAKLFNGEVFQKYVDRIPNVHLNQLLKSGAIIARPELAAAMADQVGGNYLTTPLKGLIGGTPLNYDGQTDITATSTKTFSHSRVVAGRAKAWVEKDFSYDITGGVDFMENVAQQVSEYWDEQDQAMLVNILNGVFGMKDTAGAEFVEEHTHDISALTNTEGVLGYMDATTLNTAIQKAAGDHKGKFSLALMHSKVATDLENQNLLTYIKYNDANGIQRDTNLATLNGRLVIVDDDMPVIAGTGGAADKYVTYVFGQGAIEFTNCGAKVPYEMARDPKTNGGQDTLYSRQRKCWAPYGISFTGINDIASLSPTDAELANGEFWELVNTGGNSKEYIAHKVIPISRIISLG
jgi:hypothetical protein